MSLKTLTVSKIACAILALVFAPLSCWAVSEPWQQAENQATAQGDTNPEIEGIRATIEGYVAAVNRGDAEAAAQFWSDKGVWINATGAEVVGPAEIAKQMSADFAANPGLKLELRDLNIRFVAPNVATEEGFVRVSRPGDVPNISSYISVHVKQGDQWKLDTVRETKLPKADSHYEHLNELEWMIGQWADDVDGPTVQTTCEWTKNQNFMLRTFAAEIPGEPNFEGTQIVGWDAARKRIRSWVFDSDGGFGVGLWTRDGLTWKIDRSFQTADGLSGSSTNYFTYIDDSSFSFQSTNRKHGDESLPDIGKIIVKRIK